MKTMPNQRTVTIKLTRHEVLDLMMMCAVHGDDGEKWGKLYDKLREQLESWDEKNLDNEGV